MSRVHRVLVTGSRKWPFPELVWEKLDAEALRARQSGLEMVVVEGACPSGADRDAKDWVVDRQRRDWPVSSERHPADWSQGKSAGHRRNSHMVSLGADVVLAFILDDSPGASGCLAAARKAELLVDVTTMASGALTAS